jgi:hypothetical protein
MNNMDFVEAEKDKLLQELDHIYGFPSLPEIPALAENLEKTLQGYILTILKKHSHLLFGARYNEANHFLTLEDGKILLSIKLAEDIRNFGQLCILVQPSLFAKTKELEFHISIKGYGKIDEIVFLYPEFLPLQLDLLNSLLKNLFEVGYQWFENKIEMLSNNEKVALSKNLYGYVRSIITSDILQKHLWFATVTKGYGFRLIDHDVAMNLFKQIEPNAETFSHSTNRLAAEMLSTKLPQEKLLMPIAIAENRIMDVNISEAKYSKEGSIYSGAMSAFYGCDSFTIHPIFKKKQSSVVALYPTDKRTYFEPLITAHLERLEEICASSISRVHAALELFERKTSNVPLWGKLIGAIFRGYVDAG